MADITFKVKCGFFDSVNKDRAYSAEEMNRPYKRIITNGVFATQEGTASNDLQVFSNNSGMSITIKQGEGLFADKWFNNQSDIIMDVPANNNIVPRRDSVIVQVNKQIGGRVGNVVYREGVPNSNPMPPDINTVENVIEYRVANIYVAAGATHINQDAIVDLRGSSECPWITSLIKQVDTSTLFVQWQNAYENYYNTATEGFDEWQQTEKEAFEEFLRTLTEELTVTTNIITYESSYTTSQDNETTIPINIASYNKDKDVLQVYVNRLRAAEGVDYTIDFTGENIILTNPLQANQNVNFLVLQSVIIGDAETVISVVGNLSEALTELTTKTTQDSDWIDFWLESGATSFDESTTPSVRRYGNNTYIKGAIKGIVNAGTTFATLPADYRPSQNVQYTTSAIDNGAVVATAVIEIKTTGQLQLIAKSADIPAAAMMPISTNFILG